MDNFNLWYRRFGDEWGVWIGVGTIVCMILLLVAKRIGILSELEYWSQHVLERVTWLLVWAGIAFCILYKFDDWREVKTETWILILLAVALYELLLKPVIQKNTQDAHERLKKQAEENRRQHRL